MPPDLTKGLVPVIEHITTPPQVSLNSLQVKITTITRQDPMKSKLNAKLFYKHVAGVN